MSNDPNDCTDAELLARFRDRQDESAFAELVKRHGPMVQATGRRILYGDGTADESDVLQATFLALARSAGRIKNGSAIPGWLHKAAVRSGLALKNKSSRMATEDSGILESSVADDVDPATAVITEESMQALDEELLRLPETIRAAVVLCNLEGLSQNEAAGQLGVPPSTLKARLRKGHRLLGRRLAVRGIGLPAAGIAAWIASCAGEAGAVGATTAATLSHAASVLSLSPSSAGVLVSAEVLQISLQVSKRSRLPTAAAAVLAILLFAFFTLNASFGGVTTAVDLVGIPKGESLLVDDFEDGSITDGSPTTWLLSPTFEQWHGDSGEAYLENGSLVMTTEGATPVVRPIDLPPVRPDDRVSIRAQFRMLDPGIVPLGFNPNTGGRIFPDGSIDVVANGAVMIEGRTDLRPLREDVVMQIDITGWQRQVITMRVWRPGEPMPSAPTLSIAIPGVVLDPLLGLNGAAGGAPGWDRFPVTTVAYRYAIISFGRQTAFCGRRTPLTHRTLATGCGRDRPTPFLSRADFTTRPDPFLAPGECSCFATCIPSPSLDAHCSNRLKRRHPSLS